MAFKTIKMTSHYSNFSHVGKENSFITFSTKVLLAQQLLYFKFPKICTFIYMQVCNICLFHSEEIESDLAT